MRRNRSDLTAIMSAESGDGTLDIEKQHKKALEEDPSVFDYDGVYDDMKVKAVQPRAQDREERKPKYIQQLIDKAEQRECKLGIIYERKLAKERTKDDHLFADKDKFLTSAYKKKLQEQEKWMQEERLRELREAKENVTKKTDISDFYFSLASNIAFGGGESEISSSNTVARDMSLQAASPAQKHHKRSCDALTAAKERFLARKIAKKERFCRYASGFSLANWRTWIDAISGFCIHADLAQNPKLLVGLYSFVFI
nr:nuclear speckle splicing regulatory protein 1-like [Ipomoea batatas]